MKYLGGQIFENNCLTGQAKTIKAFMTKPFTAIDLFSGAGGLHIGFDKLDFDIKLCIDNNELVEKTHKRNFPNIPFLKKDIRDVTIEEIKKYISDANVDLILGGPPCQGFSTIGKRASSDEQKRTKHDPRNELVIEYARLINEISPMFIVMENVKGILTKDKGKYLENVLNSLMKNGYEVDFKLLNMADYGVPQQRERVIILGNKIGMPITFPEPDHSEKNHDKLSWVSCGPCLEDLEGLGDIPEFNHVALKHTSKIIERYKLIPQGGRLPEKDLPPELYRKNFGNTYKRLHPQRPALTMVPGNDAFPIHPNLHRSLTVREAARIQTFADSFIFMGNRRQQGHQVGNAVPPLFSEKLAVVIKKQLEEVRLKASTE